MRVVPPMVAAVVLSAFASNAAAAPVKQTSFCSTAKGVAAYIVSSGNAISPTGGESLATMEKKLKFAYAAIIKAEPALNASAPGSIKSDLAKTFSFINFINTKMSAVGWDFTKIAPFAHQFVAKATAAKPGLTKLDAYFKGTCHIKGA